MDHARTIEVNKGFVRTCIRKMEDNYELRVDTDVSRERTFSNCSVIPQTRKSLLATCIAVVCNGLLTQPNNACTTSSNANVCTKAVCVPTRTNVDVERR